MNQTPDWLQHILGHIQSPSLIIYGFIGWAAQTLSVRPKGPVDAIVSMIVALALANGGAPLLAALGARQTKLPEDIWLPTAAIICGFGGVILLQLLFRRLTKGLSNGDKNV